MAKKFKIFQSRFIESTDPEGKDWDVCIIEKGTSKNGFTYTKEVLEKSVPLFEGAKACLYDFQGVLKHLPEVVQKMIPGGFAKSIVGWYSDVKYSEFKNADGTLQEGVVAKFHISENAKWLRELMKDAWTHGKSLLGLSIDANATVSECEEAGVMQRIVQEILGVNSVDVVTYPSAGGEFIRLLAADEDADSQVIPKIKLEESMKKYLLKLLEMVKAKKPEAVASIDPKNITEAQSVEIYTAAMTVDAAGTLAIVEASAKEEAAADAAALSDEEKKKKEEEEAAAAAAAAAAAKESADKAAAAKATDGEKAQEALKAATKVKEEIMQMNCNSLLASVLSNSKLPTPVQEDIKERFTGRIFEAKELETVIMKSKDMLAKLSNSGDVKNMGKTTAEVTLMESDKKQAALDLMIDPKANVGANVKNVGAFHGIKEAYVAFTGDHSVSGRVTESMQSSDFPEALGVSMTRKMAKEYPLLPTTWQNIASVVPLSNFKTQEIIRFGGYGRLPVVAEKGDYTDLQGPRDEKATYSPTKKGGLAFITREMIKNDDMRFLQRLPSSLARAAAETLEYYVWNPILTNATCYDGSALGTVAHANYATTALDSASLTAAKLRMRKQRGEGSVLYAGTVTGTVATTTMEDSAAHFGSAQELAGKYVRFVYGPGAGQTSLIASHTDTVLTFAEVLTAPTTATKYQVTAASAADLRLGLKAKYLICGPDLEAAANVLLQSEKIPGYANNDINVHKGTLETISPLFLSDATDWFLSADPTMIDLMEVGFIDGQQAPTLLLQDQPANGYAFTNDQIVYKVRHEYGVAVPDFRGWDVNIVAA